MNVSLRTAGLLLALYLVGFFVSYGQQKVDSVREMWMKGGRESMTVERSSDDMKIDPLLWTLVFRAHIADTSELMRRGFDRYLHLQGAPFQDAQGRVRIEVYAQRKEDTLLVTEQVLMLGGVVEEQVLEMLVCRLYLTQVRELARLPVVQRLELPDHAYYWASPYHAKGD